MFAIIWVGSEKKRKYELNNIIFSAVVVPCLLALQEEGYGVVKGIPTLVIAASSLDDVLAISAFTVLLGITFKPNTDIVAVVFQVTFQIISTFLFHSWY